MCLVRNISEVNGRIWNLKIDRMIGEAILDLFRLLQRKRKESMLEFSVCFCFFFLLLYVASFLQFQKVNSLNGIFLS